MRKSKLRRELKPRRLPRKRPSKKGLLKRRKHWEINKPRKRLNPRDKLKRKPTLRSKPRRELKPKILPR